LKLLDHANQRDHSHGRSKLFRLAVLSATLSKVGGLGVQGIAIPLVYHTLGPHQYALYLLLTAALATISLLQMGAGPGLTRGIASANAAGAHDVEASLFSAALRLSISGAVIGAGAILAAIYLVPITHLFGPAFVADRQEILSAANVCTALLAAYIVLGVADSALAGYREHVVTNLSSFAGSVVSTVLLIIICRHHAGIVGVILTLYGTIAASKLVSLSILLIRHPNLVTRLVGSVRGSYKTLLNIGLAFWLMQLAGILEQHSGTFVMSHHSTPQATDIFAVVYRAITLAGSGILVLTQPLWPAFVDAIAHQDIAWIHRQYRRIRTASMIYSCTVALAMITVGPYLFHRVMHFDIPANYSLYVVVGVYFIANVWTHLFYVTLMGMSAIWWVVVVEISENILMILFGILLVPHFGPTGMALAYLLASIVLPAWALPILFKKQLQKDTLSAREIAPSV
jgi:O-antigen/teichoic acid export membrane protein